MVGEIVKRCERSNSLDLTIRTLFVTVVDYAHPVLVESVKKMFSRKMFRLALQQLTSQPFSEATTAVSCSVNDWWYLFMFFTESEPESFFF